MVLSKKIRIFAYYNEKYAQKLLNIQRKYMNIKNLRRLTATFTAALALIFGSSAVSAKDLVFDNVAPGTLESLVGEDTDATSLTVQGAIDVRDLDFIGLSMLSLEKLNIKDASIAAYNGFRAVSQLSEFKANEMPKLCLTGSPITEIALPQSLTEIGAGALANTKLKTLEIPNNILAIGDGAFANCNELTEVTVPASLKTMGLGMFIRCEGLKKVNFKAEFIPEETFRGCTALETVVTGPALTAIGNRAFADCSALQSVSFEGTGLRSVGDEAFRGTAMTDIDFCLQTNFNTLGSWALADNASLESVAVPHSLTTIGTGAFFNDAALTEYSFSKNVTTLGVAAYKGTSINELYFLHEKLKELPAYALYGMDKLELLHLPGALTFIGEHAMDGLTSIQEFSAPTVALVPALGEDVWGQMDKSKVKLGVPEELIDAFAEADQWRDFDIIKAHIDPPDVALDVVDSDDATVNVRWEGMTMIVSSAAPMQWVELYDTLGRKLYNSGDLKGATSVAIDTSRFTNTLYIVSTPHGSAKTLR